MKLKELTARQIRGNRRFISMIVLMLSVILLCSSTVVAQEDQGIKMERQYPLGNDYMQEAEGSRILNGWWWTSNTITYAYENGVSLSMKGKIANALNTWSSVSYYMYSVYFTFVQVQDTDIAQIVFKYEPGSNYQHFGTTLPYDVNGKPEGHPDCIRGSMSKCEVTFRDAWNGEYSYSNDDDNDLYNFESVALHEIGHVLGISHCHINCSETCKDNVMSQEFDINQIRTTLQPYDKASLIVCYCLDHPFYSKNA